MNLKKENVKYLKVYDRRTKLFGIKLVGKKEWYVEPCFEEMNLGNFFNSRPQTWFKMNGRYGLYDITERHVLIPAEYTFPLYFSNGYAITWKDYKAGVIAESGNVVIPFIYDDIDERYKRLNVPVAEMQNAVESQGKDLTEEAKCEFVFNGFACFTNEGDRKAYDDKCQPAEFDDWELEGLKKMENECNDSDGTVSVVELEEKIRTEYIKLLEMGYVMPNRYSCTGEHQDKVDRQEMKVQALIRERRWRMNESWVHNVENAKRIGRMNDLLMRAVKKAIALGKKTSKSLQWMEKVTNISGFEVEVFVHPMWQNSKSDLRYERQYKSATKEADRLIDDEDNIAPTHIWNIIAAMGHCFRHEGVGACFETTSYEYDPGDWNVKDLIGDDGQTWDECIHFPAYQDVYFTTPFHHLYCDFFDYSFEDLCNINDFRVNVKVHLQTCEGD